MFTAKVENMIAKSLKNDLGIKHGVDPVKRVTDLHIGEYEGIERGSARIVFDRIPKDTMSMIRGSETWFIKEVNAERDTVIVHLLEKQR